MDALSHLKVCLKKSLMIATVALNYFFSKKRFLVSLSQFIMSKQGHSYIWGTEPAAAMTLQN